MRQTAGVLPSSAATSFTAAASTRCIPVFEGGVAWRANTPAANSDPLQVRKSFAVIESGSTHGIVAAFTYGREDVIPDMFRSLVSSLASRDPAWERFHWYLERHIEADDEKHAPVCRRIMARLCGDDPAKWVEASCVARECIEARIALWDAIAAEIEAIPAG